MTKLCRSYTPDSAFDYQCKIPAFCNYDAGTCNLVINHRAAVDFSGISNIFSMEVVDNLVSELL
jgi:hypothetical protein